MIYTERERIVLTSSHHMSSAAASLNNDILNQSDHYLTSANLSPKYNSVFTVTNLLEESYKKHNLELAQSYQTRAINNTSPSSVLINPKQHPSTTTATASTYNFNGAPYQMPTFSAASTPSVINTAQSYLAYPSNSHLTSSNHMQLNQTHHNSFATQYYNSPDSLNGHYSIGQSQYTSSNNNNSLNSQSAWYSSQSDPRSTSTLRIFYRFTLFGQHLKSYFDFK
jgi:hypothetical protein